MMAFRRVESLALKGIVGSAYCRVLAKNIKPLIESCLSA